MIKILIIVQLLLIPFVASATDYHIGPEQAYTSIGSFPWTSLVPGDIVYIHPGTYHEFIYVSSALKGTQENPIRIVGISDGEGNKPIIDGNNATVGLNFDAYGLPIYHELLGLITFGTRATGYVYPGDSPEWIIVENLQVQNYKDVTVTDHTSVVHANYYGECVYFQAGKNITIKDMIITGCRDGIFGKDNGPIVKDITVKNSYVYGNGIPGDYLYHNVYTEVDGIVFEYNTFGPTVLGSPGNNVKDRSGGFIFRYNKVSGGAHLLDLVECQDNCANHTTASNWNDIFVYGNTFYTTHGQASQLFHLGTGDYGASADYWRKNLYFYNNTVLIHHDRATTYKINLFQVSSSGQTVYLDNNIFYTYPVTNGAQIPIIGIQQDNSNTISAAGNFTYGKNWLTPEWLESRDGTAITGTTIGLSNLFSTGTMQFVNLGGGDYHLSDNSVGIVTAGLYQLKISSGNWSNSDLSPTYDPDGISRIDLSDLGAYDYIGSSATCSDGIQNQGETGVDCGGPCDACGGSTPSINTPIHTDHTRRYSGTTLIH